MTDRICVARIGAAHGLRGEVRLQVFTEDPDAVHRVWGTDQARTARRNFVSSRFVRLKGISSRSCDDVNDRNASELLTNIELYVTRDKLPAIEAMANFITPT
jgi:16S rRNA processing protein RimM